MSIQSEINRIKNNVDLSLEAVASKGVPVPADANSDNLPQLIEAISAAPDPTTVWEIAETPLVSTLGTVDISFSSAGLDFVRLLGSGTILYYINSGGGGIAVHNRGSWSNSDYRTITIHEEIKDEAFLAWLKTEATLISGVIDDGSYDEGYADGLVDGAEKVKTEEARDEDSVTYGISPNKATVTIAVSSGYYAENTSKVISSDELEPMTEIFYERGHEAGYESGYSDGLAAGGGSSDPTTVWQINDVPDVSSLPNLPAQAYAISFTSNDTSYNGIFSMYFANVPNKINLRYVTEGTSYITAWSASAGWANEAYKTITIHEEITDEGLLDWLNANATLVSSGSGGGEGGGNVTDPLLEEMLIATDENYDDEGKQFYSVYKWLGMYHSNFSSSPWMLELENEHPTLWLHVYIWVDGKVNTGYDEETGEPFYDYVSHNYVLTLEPDYGVNSIEEDEMEVTSFRIEGVRWSTDGV